MPEKLPTCKWCSKPVAVSFHKRKDGGTHRHVRTTCGLPPCVKGYGHKRENCKRVFKGTGTCEHCGASMIMRSPTQRLCKTCIPTRGDFFRMIRYNVSRPDFDAQLARQNYTCAICDKPNPYACDHDHATGKFRGILCYGCNTALAILENETLLPKAQAYLSSGGVAIPRQGVPHQSV